MKYRISTAALVLAAAGAAFGQPVLDGKIDGPDAVLYGAAKWVNNIPTGFGDNNSGSQPPCSGFGGGIRIAINNSNVAGVDGGTGPSSGAGVTTGVEIAIPLSRIGNPTGAVRVGGFITSGDHGFLSNQFIGSLPDGTGNLGEPRVADLTTHAGDQHVEVPSAVSMCTSVITMDGQADGAYGAALWTQSLQTQFGDAASGNIDFTGGSEIDQLFGFICNADLGDGEQAYLFLLVAGNTESNFNKLDLFFDSIAGGQNQLRGDNPDVDFNGLNRMGDNGVNPGLKFDAGFESDFFLQFTCGDSGGFATFASFAETLTGGGGQGSFIGSGGSGTNALVAQPCPPTLPDVGLAYGSEVDAVYSHLDVPNNKLYVLVTGNLKSSDEQHRLHLFFDANGNPVGDEGQNTMRGDNVIVGIAEGTGGAINRLGFNGVDPGLTFDTDFAADYYMVYHYEQANGSRGALDAAILRTNGRETLSGSFAQDYGTFQGKPTGTLITMDGTNFCCVGEGGGEIQRNGIRLQDGFTGDIYSAFAPRHSGDVLRAFQSNYADPFDWTLANWDLWIAAGPTAPQAGLLQSVMSNRNLLGVTDGDAVDPTSATEGIEFVIDLDELGWDQVSEIKLAGLIGNGDATFMSNQVLGGLPDGSGNFGEPRLINFSAVAGNQYVVLNPADSGTCDADWCEDGEVGVPDIFCFLTDWFALEEDARNYGGTVGVPAIFAFLSAWFANGIGPCVP